MTYGNSCSAAWENQADSIIDDMYSQFSENVLCCICEEKHSNESQCWIFPHKCAERMTDEEGYVCCEECAEEWREAYAEEIEDFELKIQIAKEKAIA